MGVGELEAGRKQVMEEEEQEWRVVGTKAGHDEFALEENVHYSYHYSYPAIVLT